MSIATTGNQLFTSVAQTIINVANPKTFIGLLIGGSIAFLFSALAIRAVGRSAGTVVQEVRRQFREHPGIMDETEEPDYARCVDIVTRTAQREMILPSLLPIVVPPDVHAELFAAAPGTTVKIDLPEQTLTTPSGRSVEFPVDAFSKHCLVNGVDELGYILQQESEIAAYEAAHPAPINAIG